MASTRPTEQELKEGLEFHEYGRFALVRNIIDANRSSEERFTILDVGGRGNRMRDFFPKDDVYYLDPFVDGTKDKNYIPGDGCDMPLADDSYDWVVSTDTFEHIVPERRSDFVKENIRVAKLGTIVCAPFYSQETADAERIANENYKRLAGVDHPWLVEHLENSLPREEEVLDFITQHHYPYQRIANNRLIYWTLLIGINYYVDKELTPEIHALWKKYNAFYNTHIFPIDHEEPGYRKVFFIKKEASLRDYPLSPPRKDPALYIELMKLFTELITRIGAQQQQTLITSHEHFLRVSSLLKGKDKDIRVLQKTIADLQKYIKAQGEETQAIIKGKDVDILHLQTAMSTLDDGVKDRDQRIQTLAHDLAALTGQMNTFRADMTAAREELEHAQAGLEHAQAGIDHFRSVVRDKDRHIQNIETLVRQRDSEIQKMQASRFWKLRNLYVRIRHIQPSSLFEVGKRGIGVLRRDDLHTFGTYAKNYILHGREYFKRQSQHIATDAYHQWMAKYEHWNDGEIAKEIQSWKKPPTISVITPVHNTDPLWLNATIESVIQQSYPHWQLCLYDDASTRRGTIETLKKWQKKDSRISVTFGKTHLHIAGASNEASKQASGTYIALLDHDDTLARHAFYEVVKTIQGYPAADFIYSDEDKIDTNENRHTPFFKPDWSPELILSMMYTGHLGVYRKEVIDAVGGFRSGFEGSQDYDLVLRVIERIPEDHIVHIPKILYHWRQILGSTSATSTAHTKAYAQDHAKRALQEYLGRNHFDAQVEDGFTNGRFRVRWNVPSYPRVSVIIPFRDKPELLKMCVESLLNTTTYPNLDIMLLDNQSQEKETRDLLAEYARKKNIRVLQYNKSFNFASINNYAVKHAKGEYILLLNNDTQAIHPDWLTAMMEYAQRPGVGIVGAKLLYPNKTVQHAGIVLGVGGIAGHAFKYLPSDSEGYFAQLKVVRNCSGVTAACLLMRKSLYEQVNGLNEEKLAASFNDVDLCLKVRALGYRIVITPYAELFHFESVSRGNEEETQFTHPARYKQLMSERKYMYDTWGHLLQHDPYYNPNLTLTAEDYGIKTS
ncbi:MAG: glycosyltransferase [Candidatus Kerfeldbacteria bacterium]|nr:glycosyltransferase [Candidatus Kerfeldbacteria bacterium]